LKGNKNEDSEEVIKPEVIKTKKEVSKVKENQEHVNKDKN
jgi:hypothetical protein